MKSLRYIGIFKTLVGFDLAYHEFIFVDGKLKLFGITDDPDFRARLEVITSQR